MSITTEQATTQVIHMLRESATELDVVYCLSNKQLGTYTIKAVLQNCLILRPTCPFQQDLFIPNPCNAAVPTGLDEDTTSGSWILTIAEYSLGGEPIDIYRLTFTWRDLP